MTGGPLNSPRVSCPPSKVGAITAHHAGLHNQGALGGTVRGTRLSSVTASALYRGSSLSVLFNLPPTHPAGVLSAPGLCPAHHL